MGPPQINRKALITGATGFVGSNLARRLIHDGWSVDIVIRPESSLALVQDTINSIVTLTHDGSTDGMIERVRQSNPDIVFHLASHFVAEHSHADVDRLIGSNILFVSQLLEAMAANNCTRMINTGSSWQYDDSGYAPVNLYAATKQAAADILTYYCDAYDLKAITLNLFDTYGPNDPRKKLFASLGNAIHSGVPLSLSPGEQLIDLVYIDDVVDAYIQCAKLLEHQQGKCTSYGLSSGHPRTLRNLVTVIEATMGVDVPVNWGARQYRTREVMVPWAHATPPPGWRPETSLETGIIRTMKPLGQPDQ